MILFSDFLLNSPAASLLQSECVVDSVTEPAIVGMLPPAGLTVMALNASLDRSRLADINYLVMR
jgi:hypothetical protein